MECNFDIEVKKPDASDILFSPYVIFRIRQLNMTPNCMNDKEIDEQINLLIQNVKELGKRAKKKLKTAKLKHDKLLSERK